MKTLYVYADFNWMPEVELIGTLSYESLRGSDSYGFRFDNQWLSRYGALYLSDDLNNCPKCGGSPSWCNRDLHWVAPVLKPV